VYCKTLKKQHMISSVALFHDNACMNTAACT
jgi:hypothetical protein